MKTTIEKFQAVSVCLLLAAFFACKDNKETGVYDPASKGYTEEANVSDNEKAAEEQKEEQISTSNISSLEPPSAGNRLVLSLTSNINSGDLNRLANRLKDSRGSVFLDMSSATGISVIEENAFKGCTALKEIILPENLTAVKGGAFAGCTKLASVSLGKNLGSIEQNAFQGCSNLTSLTVDPDNAKYGSANNMIYLKDSGKLFLAAPGIEIADIPGSIGSVGQGAFLHCKNLKSVSIGNGVNEIESSAFAGAFNLRSINIPDSVKAVGSRAFDRVRNLNMSLGSSVHRISYQKAFDGCNAIRVNIAEGVTGIGYGAFEGCTAIKSVTIADTVATIGQGAFWGCTGLESVALGNGLREIDGGAFSHCDRLNKISFKGSGEQWKRVAKGYGWHQGVPASFVALSDGSQGTLD